MTLTSMKKTESHQIGKNIFISIFVWVIFFHRFSLTKMVGAFSRPIPQDTDTPMSPVGGLNLGHRTKTLLPAKASVTERQEFAASGIVFLRSVGWVTCTCLKGAYAGFALGNLNDPTSLIL